MRVSRAAHAAGLTAAITAASLPGHVTRVASLLHAHLPAAALAEGLYMAPRGQMSISTPMDESVVDAGIAAFVRASDLIADRTGART